MDFEEREPTKLVGSFLKRQGLVVPKEKSGRALVGARLGQLSTGPEESVVEPVGRKDAVLSAVFLPPSSVAIRFADGFEGEWTLQQLDFDSSGLELDTLRAADDGATVQIKSQKGDWGQIDSAILRYLVDAEYAAECDRNLERLQLAPEVLERFVKDNPPPPEWYAEDHSGFSIK